MAVDKTRAFLQHVPVKVVGERCFVSPPICAGAIKSQLSPPQQKEMLELIDFMGLCSAKAQGYAVITSSGKLMKSDHRVYFFVDGSAVVGLIKVGVVNLYVYDAQNKMHNLKPLCILDFYVDESRQRTGVGKLLFDHMCLTEKVRPYQCGYDRPSQKFLKFLDKYFALSKFTPQVNGFVVFNEHFIRGYQEPKWDVEGSRPQSRTAADSTNSPVAPRMSAPDPSMYERTQHPLPPTHPHRRHSPIMHDATLSAPSGSYECTTSECVCVYVCVCVCVCFSVFAYEFVCVYLCLDVCVYECMYECMYE
jgi:alpha-tubulin N-acetyltransferase 1